MFKIIKKAIPQELASFLSNYLLLKRRVAKTFNEVNYLPGAADLMGTWKDHQVPGAYSLYGDIAMETLLYLTQPLIERTIKKSLVPTYAYTRIYVDGNILHRHKDRLSCELSATLHLGGSHPWNFFVETNPRYGSPPDKVALKLGQTVYKKKGSLGKSGPQWKGYWPSMSKGKKLLLKPGDMLIYTGHEMEHWREAFKGTYYAQVFLHYNLVKTSLARRTSKLGQSTRILNYDGRPHLGLPANFRKNLSGHNVD